VTVGAGSLHAAQCLQRFPLGIVRLVPLSLWERVGVRAVTFHCFRVSSYLHE
jgi:hypothetical protein